MKHTSTFHFAPSKLATDHLLHSLQVWYCTVKGIKPWLAPDAKNTRTNEQGGHTIWYEEPQLLQVRQLGTLILIAFG